MSDLRDYIGLGHYNGTGLASKSLMATVETARTQYVKASNGITFAYRRVGQNDGVPLVMSIHFRGNMDLWDPLLVNNIAAKRPVILFDQSGVGKSDGDVQPTYQGWADNIVALVEALEMEQVDLLGFSMGGFAVQMVALTTPGLVRKLIIAGSSPSVPTNASTVGIVWPRDEPSTVHFMKLANASSDSREAMEDSLTYGCFNHTDAGRAAGKAYWERVYQRTPRSNGGEETVFHLLDPEQSGIQVQAFMEWTSPNPRNSFDRLGELKMPTLILNGDNDQLVPTSRSFELLKHIDNAQLIIYPRAGHGFIWQYAERVAEDVNKFLDVDLVSNEAKA